MSIVSAPRTGGMRFTPAAAPIVAPPPAQPAAPGLLPFGAGAPTLRTAELLGALSHALDLTEGQPVGHTMRSCLVGMRIGAELDLDAATLSALYYALLLKDAGCSSNAARMAALFGGDDQAIKPRMKLVDWHQRVRLAVQTLRTVAPGGSVRAKLRHFLGIAREGEVTRALIQVRCDRGGAIALGLGFDEASSEAIRSLDEHWNGGGYPEGRSGEAIPLLARILNVAQMVEMQHALGGVDAVVRTLRARRGSWFDPRLVDLVLGWRRDGDWWRTLVAPGLEGRVLALEPAAHERRLDDDGLDRVAFHFADIVDAKSPFTHRHSVLVARYAGAIAAEMGMPRDEVRRVLRAGWLHDIGKLGISNRLLDKAGGLTPEERAAMERHPLHTWDILSRIRAFDSFARLASLHHEKLDGSGYPWRVPGEKLSPAARALVVADILEALTADRPYRAGLPIDEALGILRRDRGTRLCTTALDACEAALEGGRLVIGAV